MKNRLPEHNDHFLVIIALQTIINNESLGNLYSLKYQIFGKNEKWLDLKLKNTWMTRKKEKKWKELMNEYVMVPYL